jgi:hypothetical protein
MIRMSDFIFIVGGGVVVATLLLFALLFLLARHEADYDLLVCAGLAAPIVVVPALLFHALAGRAPPAVALAVPPVALLAVAVPSIARRCGIGWLRALAVAALLLVGLALVGVGVAALGNSIYESPAPAAPSPPRAGRAG